MEGHSTPAEAECDTCDTGSAATSGLVWGMSVGFVMSFIFVAYHTHFALHLTLGYTVCAMFGYLFGVFGLLFANFWFMAGQRMVLQALALYDPTSCVMEWLHDAVFGISEERMASAQQSGKKAKMKDGKTYVQMVVSRRKVPYPLSMGGALHLLFFNVDDQFDSGQVVQQVLRSTMILSIAVLLIQTSIMDWMFGADALFSDARTLQQQGNIDAAVDHYMTVLKQDPLHNPHVAAIHFSLLPLQHAWAAGLYLVAATFHADGDTAQAIQHYTTVLQHAPDCVLASHALRSLQGSDAPPPSAPPDGGAPLEYVRAAFDGYAGSYDAAMARLSYRAPDMLAEALREVLRAAGEDGAGGKRRALELGCGTGMLAARVQEWVGVLECVDASPRMLAAAGRTGGYSALVEGDMEEFLVFRREELDLLLAADAVPYKGDVRGLLGAAARAVKPGGRFAFTVEAFEGKVGASGDAGGWRLLESGRVAHSRGYVEEAALSAGWLVDAVGGGLLRWEGARAVQGHVFVLRKP